MFPEASATFFSSLKFLDVDGILQRLKPLEEKGMHKGSNPDYNTLLYSFLSTHA